MRIKHVGRRSAAVGLSATLAVFGLPVLAPAGALPPPALPDDVQAVLAGVGSFAGFTHSLGTQGALGQPLPLVTLTPGGADGLAFAPSGSEAGLLDAAVAKTLTDRANSANDGSHTVVFGDLAPAGAQPVTFTDGSGRTGNLTVIAGGSAATQETLDISLTVTRTVANQGLKVSGSAGGQRVDLSSTSGVSVTLTSTIHFVAAVTPALSPSPPFAFAVLHDATNGPAIAVGADATIPTPAAVNGAVGILGVTMSAATFDSVEHVGVSLDDPNNDGQLAFTNPDGTTGELGQSGASTGLVHVATPTGSVTNGSGGPASFTLATANTTEVPGLPAVSTVITASWPDVAAGAPVLGADSGLAAANDFLNLTPKDLGDGLAHLANAVTAIQRAQWTSGGATAGNVALPYMKGSLADAIDASAALSGFVAETTYNPANPFPGGNSTDPAKTGLPTFASIQQLVADLHAFASSPPGVPAIPTSPPPPAFAPLVSGSTITVGTIHFNDSADLTNKLLIPLTITTPSGSSVDLDARPLLAGGALNTTYGASTLTDASSGISFPSSLNGQTVQVTSGVQTITGIVDHIAGNVLTMKAQTQVAPDAYWVTTSGATTTKAASPAAGSAYQILGSDPQTGALAFGDAFKSVGITKANADASSATVTRSSTLNLGLVLDLEPPIIGSACNSAAVHLQFPQYGELPHSCPFSHTNPDGSTSTITQLPTNTDRVMLRTNWAPTFLTADFPITSNAPTDFAAKVGYLAVHLTGHLDLTKPVTGDMLTIALKPQTTADGSSDLSLDQIIRGTVITPGHDTTLLTETLHAGVTTSLSVDVPGSSSNSTLPSSPTFFGATTLPGMTINWSDIGTGAAPVPSTDSALAELDHFAYDSANPTALVAPLVKSLQVLDGSLGSLGAQPTLGTPVPVVGRSVGSLLAAQDSGAGPGVTYGTASGKGTLTDAGRHPDPTNDPLLVGHTMTVGTASMTIGAVAAGGGGTLFTFSAGFPTVPANGTPYSLTSPLADVTAALAAQPPGSLQDFLGGLAMALGDGSTATIGEDATTHALVVYLDWKRASHTASTLALPFTPNCTTTPCAPATLIAASAAPTIPIGVTAENNVGFEVPLAAGSGPADATALQVQPSSVVGGNLDITFNGTGAPAGTIGRLNVNLGSGSEQIQLRGGYHVVVTGSGSTPEALSSLVGTAPTVTAPGVDCPAASATDQALCAHIPVYEGATSVGPITVTIPKTTPLVPTIDAGTKTLGDDIANANKVIGFAGMADNISHYFDVAQEGLNAASFNGRLPLVGHDLQAGSDFIGTLKRDFNTAVGNFVGAYGTTASSMQTKLQTELTNALPGPTGRTITVNVACKAPLNPVSGFGVTPHFPTPPNPPPATAHWDYEVVAYHTDGSTKTLTTAAGPVDAVNTNPLSATSYNSLSWNADDGATGYLVLRSAIDASGKATGVYGQIADKAAGVTTLDDNGLASSAFTGTIPSRPPMIDYPNCPGSTDISYITSVTANVKAGDKATATVPFDIGIPGLALKATGETPGLKASASWSLDLTFGVDREKGFFVKGGNNILSVQAEVQSPSDMQAQIAFLAMQLHDKSSGLRCGSDTNLGSNVCITAGINLAHDLTAKDLANPSGLRSELSASISGGVNLDWGFKVDPAVPADQQLLPGVTGDFVVGWNPSFSTTDGDIKSGDLNVAFNDVAIDAGGFLSGVLGPIIKQVKAITDPIQPVIDQLTAPIPVLSDLSHLAGGGDVTLLSIAEAFNTLAGGPDLHMINTVVSIIALFKKIDSIDCSPPTDCSIPIGSFDISGSSSGDPQGLVDNAVTPDAGPSLDKVGALPATAPDVGAALDSHAGKGNGDVFKSGADKAVTLNDNCAPSTTDGTTDTEKAGITFPVIQHPMSIFGLLLGRDITLACFDSGFLSIGFSYSQAFGPVYAPPPVLITISGSASATLHLVGGFDTYGMRTAVENIAAGKASSATPLQFLDSLFLTTTDANGNPLPVVTLTGRLAAGAEVSAVIISVGIQGGIQLTINFTWRDPDNDGKFRFDEFLVTALSNPLCLFNVSGSLSVFLELDITIGFSPFSYTFSITLVNITLLDFSISPDCTPPPPVLGAEDGPNHTLIVYAGQLGNGSGNLRGDPAWDNHGTADETFKITQYHAGSDGHTTGYAIDALGVHDTFPADITSVYVDGQGYTGNMTITMQGALDPADAPTTAEAGAAAGQSQSSQKFPFTADATVYGGNGSDTITTGQGSSYIDGGPGNDHITTADIANTAGQKAVVAGGGGDDQIRVGNADDSVAGDSALTVPAPATWSGVSIPSWTATPSFPGASALAVSGGTDGNDVVTVGLGKSTVWGNGGNDTLTVTPDSPAAATDASLHSKGAMLIGGDGADVISGGNGDDTIYTGVDESQTTDGGSRDSGAADACTAGDPASLCPGGVPLNRVDTGGGFDPNTGAVVGGGSDTVYGSTGVDDVTAHSAPGQTATIYGGGANDVLVGGYGTDRIYGGPGDDYVIAEPSTVGEAGGDDVINSNHYGPHRDVTHNALPANVSPSSKVLVGGVGNDHVIGGDGGATIYGDAGTETACPTGLPASDGSPPAETGQGSDGNDLITGGSGVDVIQAGGGNDYVDSGTNSDFLCGGAGDDTLLGHSLANQTDTVYGGSGADVAVGGDGPDWIFGNTGDDHLYGGNGNDTLEGNDGLDSIFGGAGDDLIIGGTSASGQLDEGDLLYGDSGNDRIVGDNGAQTSGGGVDMTQPGVVSADVLVAYDLADGNGVSTHGAKDVIFGGDGNDIAYGGLGNDTISGGNGNDSLEGNDGSDTIHGDAGDDVVIGGTSLAAQPDTGDFLFGDAGNDLIVGDNGAQVVGGVTDATQPVDRSAPGVIAGDSLVAYDLADGNGASAHGGNDQISGGDGNDVAYGAVGDDTISGGNGDDHLEGNDGSDTITGDGGNDDIIGGSSQLVSGSGTAHTAIGYPDTADTLYGGDGEDVVLGDNGAIRRSGQVGYNSANTFLTANRVVTARTVLPYDLGDTPTAGSSGNDFISGDAGNDILLGQGGDDRVLGGDGNDYLEGGSGNDWLQGDAGDDDLVGGSSIAESGSGDKTVGQPDTADVLLGGAGDDTMTGDNARITIVPPATAVPRVFQRLGSTGLYMRPRQVSLFDLNNTGASAPNYLTAPDGSRYGNDQIDGGAGNDVIYGQDGNDAITGGTGSDYVEGNGGQDVIKGDLPLDSGGDATVAWAQNANWAGSSGGLSVPGYVPPLPDAVAGTDGTNCTDPNTTACQDDLIGGSSIQAFRDTVDTIEGDYGDDFVLGDNGTLVRDVLLLPGGGPAESVFSARNPATTVIRHHDDTVAGLTSTRFCTTAQPTCEPAGAFGNDVLYGDAGNDNMWGQDGNDTMSGGLGNDDMYGELGTDTMDGGAGEDVMLGDRGGAVDVLQSGSSQFSVSLSSPPQETYTGLRPGTYARQVDMLHDVDGAGFVGGATSAPMPHAGMTEGGNDTMTGGAGHDTMHGEAGNDLMNGDAGGDTVFGDDGADVIYGGQGCDPNASAANQDVADLCPTLNGLPGLPDLTARGPNDRWVDYEFGGKGGTDAVSQAGALGSDLMDFAPRGTYAGCTTNPWPVVDPNGTVHDPCAWWVITNRTSADPNAHQDHQGTDWMYGGWDRDIMQGDVAANGPNPGDRLLDWTGAYNLYTHCNSAYGGFNDVRQFSPGMQTFLQRWAAGSGAGQGLGDVTTSGTSAFDELAMVYTSDISSHGSGSAYPSTPGHFDGPLACAP